MKPEVREGSEGPLEVRVRSVPRLLHSYQYLAKLKMPCTGRRENICRAQFSPNTPLSPPIKYLVSPIKSFPSRSVMWRCNKYCLLALLLLSFQMMIKYWTGTWSIEAGQRGIFASFSRRALVPNGGKSGKSRGLI